MIFVNKFDEQRKRIYVNILLLDMKKNKALFLLSLFLLGGCASSNSSFIDSSISEETTSDESTSESTSSFDDPSTTSEESVDESTSDFSSEDSTSEESTSEYSSSESESSEDSSTEEDDDGITSIREVKELCKTITDLNISGIAIDQTRKVTIKGLAISRFSLVKTTSKFGLNVSYADKILMGDDTGYIGVATNNTKDGTSFWGKVNDHAGKNTSVYTVTGYLSMYLNQPELYIESFTWNEGETMNLDYTSYSNGDITLDTYYDKATETNYNCAGHGYGDIYTVKNVYCFDKRDNVYFFTDGTSVMKAVKGLAAYTVGQSYDITGYISLNNWIPSIYTLTSNKVNDSSVTLSNEHAVTTTITDFKKNKSSKDDTSSKMTNYIRSFKTIYKATVYVDAYTENGKCYVTMGDRFIEGTQMSSSHLKSHIVDGEISISNDNYWDVSENQMYTYCPLKDYLFEEETVDVYFYQYLQEWGSYGDKKNQPIWKVMVINDFIA